MDKWNEAISRLLQIVIAAVLVWAGSSVLELTEKVTALNGKLDVIAATQQHDSANLINHVEALNAWARRLSDRIRALEVKTSKIEGMKGMNGMM